MNFIEFLLSLLTVRYFKLTSFEFMNSNPNNSIITSNAQISIIPPKTTLIILLIPFPKYSFTTRTVTFFSHGCVNSNLLIFKYTKINWFTMIVTVWFFFCFLLRLLQEQKEMKKERRRTELFFLLSSIVKIMEQRKKSLCSRLYVRHKEKREVMSLCSK